MFVDPNRLIEPQDKFQEAFPGLDFREVYTFNISNKPLLITDPTYLADVYNSDGSVASYFRQNGVIIMDFGGDVNCPVMYKDPYVLFPIAMHYEFDMDMIKEVQQLADSVFCDSGSLIFLPMADDFPEDVSNAIGKVMDRNNGSLIDLTAGEWRILYEQWDPPEDRHHGLYRNIVLQRL